MSRSKKVDPVLEAMQKDLDTAQLAADQAETEHRAMCAIVTATRAAMDTYLKYRPVRKSPAPKVK